jgi:hypothetical protein
MNHLTQQSDTRKIRVDQMCFVALMVGVLLLSFGVRLLVLNNFLWDYDEGIHVLLARLLAAGYEPYSELFVSYPPLFVWSLEWPWRIWGTVEALQYVMVGYSLLGIVAVAILAFRLSGWLAGVIAATVLSFSGTYLAGSRAVMTEVPSVSLGALAVALAALYHPTGRRGWLLISGLVTAASLMLKILSPFVPGLILFMLFVRRLGQGQTPGILLKGLIRDGLVWAAGFLAPLLVALVLYDAGAMYRQIIAFRLDTRIAYSEDSAENVTTLLAFAQGNLPVVVAMAWGVAVVIRNRTRILPGRSADERSGRENSASALADVGPRPKTTRRWSDGWLVITWLILAMVFTLLQVPLRDKHIPVLLPPLAVLAGVGLADGWQTISSLARNKRSLIPLVSFALAVVLTVGYFWQVARELAVYRQTATNPLNDNERMLAEYLQRFTSPNDCLVTDNPSLAFFAERWVPPNLSEVSSARLRSGYLTYDELVSDTQAYSCQVVAPVAKRLQRTRHDYVEWVKEHFLGLWLYDGATEVLLAQPLGEVGPSRPLQATFGERVELVGYDLIRQVDALDHAIYLSLYWRTLQPLTADYTVFVHLRDAENHTLINGDHQPYNNLVPTSSWPVGRIVKETIRLDVPHSLPAGEYQLRVGLYLSETLERLPLRGDISNENAVIIPGGFVSQ